jgi:type III pantothenate kinase
MNLVIDRGNTRLKMAIFDGSTLVDIRVCDALTDEFLEDLRSHFPLESAIFCSVAGNDEPIIAILRRHFPEMLQMPHGLKFSISCDYDLRLVGADRIAAAVGARVCVPTGNLFVVDAGTCVTYDFLSADNHFECGNIAPGYELRLKAMHHFTGKLPQVEPTEPEKFMAAETVEAMRAGAFNGIVFEIEGYMRYLQYRYPDIKLVLGGGIATLLRNKIKNCTFAEPNLALVGLNEILTENKD